MRILVYGAGAIGGVLGALLHKAGHEVTLVARGAHLAAIRDDGLRLESPDGAETLRIPAVASPANLPESPDAVLLTMKTNDTAAAVEAMTATVGSDTPVACVQNGVENERMVLRGYRNAYAVCVMFPAAHLTPGVVEAQSNPVPGILDIGRYPGGVDDSAQAIATAFRDAGFESVPRPDIMRWKYRKLVMNLGNAITALCTESEERAELLRELRAEGETALAAAGVEVVTAEQDAERRGDLLQVRPIDGRPRSGGSTWQSLHRGTGSIESAYLNGEVAMLGRIHGVPTPLNDVALRLALAAARGEHPPRSLPVAVVRERLAGVLPLE